VGKSTLFNALTAAGAESANYPFCTIEPNVGIVPVPDERLKRMAEIPPRKKIPPWSRSSTSRAWCAARARARAWATSSWATSAHRRHPARGALLRRRDIVHVDGGVNPLRDIETINIELALADLTSVEKQAATATPSSPRAATKRPSSTPTSPSASWACWARGPPVRAASGRAERASVKECQPHHQQARALRLQRGRRPAVTGNALTSSVVKVRAAAEGAGQVVICAQIEPRSPSSTTPKSAPTSWPSSASTSRA
jgi:hypothetical protein